MGDNSVHFLLHGRKRTKVGEAVTYLKWTDEQKYSMALYLKENFKSYQTVGVNGSRKTLFLRKMKEVLKFQCSDKQLANGFDSVLRKYKTAKDKLNATGFGIDPERDTSIKEGFLKNFCPYYEILDEVMGNRPNISPPFTLESGAEAEVDESGESTLPRLELVVDPDSTHSIGEKTAEVASKKTKDMGSPEVVSLVRKSFTGIGVKKLGGEETNKNPVAEFIKVLGDKMSSGNSVELQRVQLEREKFDYDKQQQLEKVQNIKDDREHELKKMKLGQEFELEKLKLQIELEKMKSLNKT